MATNAPRREEFDPGRSFVVTRCPAGTVVLRVAGTEFRPGKPFQKNLVSVRKLRQLFDMRYLGMTNEEPLPPLFQKPNFSALPDPAIREWLRAHGVVPRLTATTVQITARASEEWEKRFGAMSKLNGRKHKHHR